MYTFDPLYTLLMHKEARCQGRVTQLKKKIENIKRHWSKEQLNLLFSFCFFTYLIFPFKQMMEKEKEGTRNLMVMVSWCWRCCGGLLFNNSITCLGPTPLYQTPHKWKRMLSWCCVLHTCYHEPGFVLAYYPVFPCPLSVLTVDNFFWLDTGSAGIKMAGCN